jgi:uncharacterized sporulation protein YeaH/YhbH (DUF444 family)
VATLDRTKSIHERVRDFPRIQEALRQATLDAIRVHKQAGVPMVMYRNGELVRIPAEELEAELLAEEKTQDPTRG